MRIALALMLAACGSSGGGGGGPGGTSRVFHIEVPLDTMTRRCIEGTLVMPLECNAWFHLPDATDDAVDACDATMSTKPCWHLVGDVTCGLGDHQALEFVIATAPPAGTLGIAECLGR